MTDRQFGRSREPWRLGPAAKLRPFWRRYPRPLPRVGRGSDQRQAQRVTVSMVPQQSSQGRPRWLKRQVLSFPRRPDPPSLPEQEGSVPKARTPLALRHLWLVRVLRQRLCARVPGSPGRGLRRVPLLGSAMTRWPTRRVAPPKWLLSLSVLSLPGSMRCRLARQMGPGARFLPFPWQSPWSPAISGPGWLAVFLPAPRRSLLEVVLELPCPTPGGSCDLSRSSRQRPARRLPSPAGPPREWQRQRTKAGCSSGWAAPRPTAGLETRERRVRLSGQAVRPTKACRHLIPQTAPDWPS